MQFEPSPRIYTLLTEALTLDPKTREELKVKRGFTDETIDILKFKTAKPENADIIKELYKKHGSAELFTCGLIDREGKPSWQFTQEGMIIIPYLGIDGKTVHFFKSHKRGGLAGSGVMPYSPFLFDQHDKDTIILCESEFKAAAMHQMGFRSVGLSGISTFASEHIDKLTMCFTGATKGIILFDTEIQDDPAFASYKEEYKSRYAQYIWSFNMGKKLEVSLARLTPTPKILIATLPESWTVNGKADIDSCVASGKTRDDFERVLLDALPPDVYQRSWNIDKKHSPWVKRRIARTFSDQNIRETGGKYYLRVVKRVKGIDNKITEWKELSNFVVKIKNTIEKNGEIYREIIIVSCYGDVSKTFTLSKTEMASFKSFKEMCLGKGDYMWKGIDNDWNSVVEHLFLETDPSHIQLLESVGRDGDNKQWTFENIIFKDDGRILKPALDGVTFWDKEKGFRLVPFNKGPMPSLSEEPIDCEEVMLKFKEAWGIKGVLAFAYTLACLFSNVVFKEYKAFPFLMLWGEKESGKSTLSDMLMSMLGFPPTHAALNISETSQVAMARTLAYYSSLPCRFDEYRVGDRKINDKQSLLRSVYNRQSASKGLRNQFGVRQIKISGNLILIGEELPPDLALQSRMIAICLNNSNRTNKSYEAVKWLYDNHNKFSNITYQILKDYKKLSEKIVIDIEETRKGLARKLAVFSNIRSQVHYATVMSALCTLFPREKTEDILSKFFDSFMETSKTSVDESLLGSFFADIVTMKIMGEPVDKYIAISLKDSNEVAMYIPGLYNAYAKFKTQRGGAQGITTEKTVRQYLRGQSYYIGNGAKRRLPVGEIKQRINCVLLRKEDKTMPTSLKELIEDAPKELEGDLGGTFAKSSPRDYYDTVDK